MKYAHETITIWTHFKKNTEKHHTETIELQACNRGANYRPHPKGGEGTIFTGVCLFARGVLHIHPIILPLQLVPCPFVRGGGAHTPSPYHNSSTGSRSLPGMGYPSSRTGWGHHPVQDWMEVSPPGTGWGYHHSFTRIGWGYLPVWDWMVLGHFIPRAVCLLWFPAGGLSCYCPHLKDGGRNCFQFVSSHLNRELPHLADGEGGVPHPRSGWGYPIPGLDRGTPSQVQMRVPHPRSGQGGGYPILLTEGTPIPGMDGGVPHPAVQSPSKIRTGGGTPHQDWMRSRRWTFLFNILLRRYYYKKISTMNGKFLHS